MGLTPADERRIKKIIRDTLRLPRYLPQLSDEVPDDGDVINWDDDKKKYRPTAPAAGHNSVTLDANADTLLSLSTQELGLDTQSANKIYAGPTSGAAAVPSFRDMVDADIPSAIARDSELHNQSHVLTGSDHTESGLTDGHFLRATGASSFGFEADYYTVNFIIDGGGAEITTGVKGDVELPMPGVVEEWRMLADQSGSITVDIWQDTYANFPPTDADSVITPSITSAQKNQATGQSTNVSAEDILRFNVDSATTIQRVTVALKVRKT